MTGTEMYDMDAMVLRRALDVLAAQGKAQLFQSDNSPSNIGDQWICVPSQLLTDMKKQYLQDPTVPKADEQQHSELQQPDPSAADAQFNKYFWRHLQFRWDCGLLPRSSGLGSSQQYITTDVVIDNFQDNLFNLCRLYLQSAPLVMLGPDDAVQIPLGYIAYPDLSRVLSVPYRTDYGDISSQLNKFFSFDRFQPYNAIENGAFGAFNHGYVMEIPDLMERYLEVINEDDLYLPLQALQENAVYDIFIKVIALEDPARVQYFFNDIMAYQVIPNFVMAHVGKGYYDQALAFINRMRTNTYLSKLFNRIPADGHPNYYEQAVYMALGYTMNENATKFVMRLIAEHNLRINRMYQCELSYNLSNVVKDNLKSLYDEELLSAPVAIEECLEFTYQFFRGSRLNLNYFGIYGNI
ncbi:hypothetical protein H4R35_005651 [Dimargaris xerosporica]|nr:hypothetical protein H4R35_005651 [Dimargaris xerosporica]